MDEETLSSLKQLAKHLAQASACISQVPATRELESVSAQLQSLKLILDHNCEALLMRIADSEREGRFGKEPANVTNVQLDAAPLKKLATPAVTVRSVA